MSTEISDFQTKFLLHLEGFAIRPIFDIQQYDFNESDINTKKEFIVKREGYISIKLPYNVQSVEATFTNNICINRMVFFSMTDQFELLYNYQRNTYEGTLTGDPKFMDYLDFFEDKTDLEQYHIQNEHTLIEENIYLFIFCPFKHILTNKEMKVSLEFTKKEFDSKFKFFFNFQFPLEILNQKLIQI